MYEISKQETMILKHLLKKKGIKPIQRHSCMYQFFRYYLGSVNAYIILYSLSPNPGEVVHSTEWSLRKGQFSSQVSRTKCTGVTCESAPTRVPYECFATLTHDEPALSVHHHKCLFLFTLGKIVPLTFQSSFVQASESMTSHPSFRDRHWPPVVCPRTHLFTFFVVI